jgi:hypothetical protein
MHIKRLAYRMYYKLIHLHVCLLCSANPSDILNVYMKRLTYRVYHQLIHYLVLEAPEINL